MIKILQIVPSMRYGGVETVVMNYYRHLDKTNLQLDFGTYTIVDELRSEIEANNGKIYFVNNKNKHPLKRFNDVYQLAKCGKYDIVQVHSDSASLFLDLLAAKIAGTRVRIAHSHNTNCFVKWQHYLLKPFIRFVANEKFACSDAAGKWMFGNNPYKVIINGIDFNKYGFKEKTRKTVRDNLNWKDNVVIGHVGNYQKSKNQIFLVKMLPALIAKYPNIKIGFVGTYSDEAKSFVEENTLEQYVDFLGIRKDVQDVLQGFDLFCFPSLFEGNPSAVTEACASCLPCIISDQTFDAMCKINFNKYFYHLPLDINAWVNKVSELIDENNKRIPLTAKEIEESGFDINTLGLQLTKLYEDLGTNK